MREQWANVVGKRIGQALKRRQARRLWWWSAVCGLTVGAFDWQYGEEVGPGRRAFQVMTQAAVETKARF